MIKYYFKFMVHKFCYHFIFVISVINKFVNLKNSNFMHRRSARPNIDQLLREGLLPPKSEGKKSVGQIESSLRIQSGGIREHKIVFTESPVCLQASELLDFSRVTMLDNDGLDAFVGANSGVVKGLNFNKASFVNFRSKIAESNIVEGGGAANAAAPITAMSFSGRDESELLIASRNGQVGLFNTLTETLSTLFKLPEEKDAWIKGIHAIKGDRVLTASSSGNLAIWDASSQQQLDSNGEWSAGDGLLTMRLAPGDSANIIATGGKENPLKLWAIDEQKCTFTAKNVRPDNLELRVPICVTNSRFLDNSTNLVVTSNENAQIRLYDVRAQRRPTLQEDWLDTAIQALSTCSRDWHVLAGNNRGELGMFDLRSTAKCRCVSKYKGFSGAIRCIDATADEPQILSCGIDRFAILHNLDSREIIRKIYCKVQLNCCLLRANNPILSPNQDNLEKRKRKHD